MDEPGAPGDRESGSLRTVAVVFASVVGLAAVAGNSLTLVAAIKCPDILHIKKYAIIISLAVADLGVGVESLAYIYGVINRSCGKLVTELFFDVPMYAMITSSVMHLFAMAVERFVAILYPLRYESIVTAPRMKYTIVSCWAVSVGFGVSFFAWLPYVYGTDVYVYCHHRQNIHLIFKIGVMLCIYVLVGLAFGLLYWRILHIVRKQARIISSEARQLENIVLPRDNMRAKAKVRVSSKGTRMVFVIMSMYLISWGPHFVASILEVMHSGKAYAMAVSFTLELGLMNSCVNVLLYAYMNQDFRKAYRLVLHLKDPRD